MIPSFLSISFRTFLWLLEIVLDRGVIGVPDPDGDDVLAVGIHTLSRLREIAEFVILDLLREPLTAGLIALRLVDLVGEDQESTTEVTSSSRDGIPDLSTKVIDLMDSAGDIRSGKHNHDSSFLACCGVYP